mmetsp:Transcript_16772/g.39187  ORF Transcript_16772/g.39187 Transcript_16772/m.39187 type:complete len:243 (+) Transcript_16772:1731-2459(+)
MPAVEELRNVYCHKVRQVLENNHHAVEEHVVHRCLDRDFVPLQDLGLIVQEPKENVAERNACVANHTCGEICEEANHVLSLPFGLGTTSCWLLNLLLLLIVIIQVIKNHAFLGSGLFHHPSDIALKSPHHCSNLCHDPILIRTDVHSINHLQTIESNVAHQEVEDTLCRQQSYQNCNLVDVVDWHNEVDFTHEVGKPKLEHLKDAVLRNDADQDVLREEVRVGELDDNIHEDAVHKDNQRQT